MTFRTFFAAAVLPPTLTDFERSYLARMNRIALIFFALHVPLFATIAWANDTRPLLAVGLTLLALTGPLLAMKSLPNPRHVSIVFGMTAMFMGALLVHFGRGLWTIEMHFYFFVALALLAVFANPMVIIVAAVTVALHHLTLWFFAPTSVFNYDAPVTSVLVHATFVVVESFAACFVARSFFDNVIGLELKVSERTRALDQRNRDMALVFEHVQQGFLTADVSGALSAQHSKVVGEWLGAPKAGEPVWAFFGRLDPRFGDWLRLGWDALVEDVMPREVCLDQLPRRFSTQGRELEVAWQPVERDGVLEQVLVLVSDVTTRVQRERAELEQRETMLVFERLMRDRAAFLDFFAEAKEQVDALAIEPSQLNSVVQLRLVHTLKGNCALFGMHTVAALCHELENRAAEQDQQLTSADRGQLSRAWHASSARVLKFLQGGRRAAIELEEADFVAIVRAIDDGATRQHIRQLVESWRLEPVKRPFERLGEQAQALGQRLGRPVTVEIDSRDLRLPRGPLQKLWSSCVHLVRNAVDHGLGEAGGRVRFGARLDGEQVVLSFSDDGRGIDWEKLEQSAQRRGLAHQSRADLEAALFADGVTTRSEVSDLSGRGVGLSAVLAAVRDLRGQVRVTSEPGKGTRIDLLLPAALVMSNDGLDPIQASDVLVTQQRLN